MRKIHPLKAALSVGIVIGLYHWLWVVLVDLGAAKSVLDFILRLHFIQLDIQLMPYDAMTGMLLVGITFTIGGMFGLIFAYVWNWLAAAGGETKPTRRSAGSKA